MHGGHPHVNCIRLEKTHLIGAPFLAMKAAWGLNQLTTEFYSLAIFLTVDTVVDLYFDVY